MFNNKDLTIENEQLKQENAKLKEHIVTLEKTIDNMELEFYRKIFKQIHFNVGGSFENDEKI
jgi:cell division protein FtsB